MRSCVLAVCFLLFSASAVYADFYRYVDKDGREFFTNDPEQIPHEYRSAATLVRPDDSRVSIGDKPATPRTTPAPSREHRDKNRRGEEYWHRKAENLRLKLREQQDEYDLVLRQIDDQDQKSKTGKKKKAGSSLEKKRMKLEKEIAGTRRMLEVDLPEEARRADAYPGWIRE